MPETAQLYTADFFFPNDRIFSALTDLHSRTAFYFAAVLQVSNQHNGHYKRVG